MRALVKVSPWCYVFWALLLLTVPLRWLCAAVCAAAFHEFCHWLVIRLSGCRVLSLRIGIGGAAIDTGAMGNRQELLCALAGPMGSLALLGLCHSFPKLALCGGVQGIFNLLPVYPLDGGRILRCTLRMLCPERGERIANMLEAAFLACLLLLACAFSLRHHMGLFPLLVVFPLIAKRFPRKKPCKLTGIGVQ